MAETAHRLIASDGTEVAAWHARPPDPRGTLVLCHGISTDAENDGLFVRLRDRATDRGLAVVRFDFRAHGRSSGSQEGLTLAGMAQDAAAALELADPELPTVVLASSFGAGPAVRAVERGPSVRGLVLWNAVVDYNASVLQPGSAFARKMIATRGDSHLPDWALQEVVERGYLISHGLARELEQDDTAQRIGRLAIPVLAVHGLLDRVVPLRPAFDLARRHPHVRLRMALLGSHGLGRAERRVTGMTLSWIDRLLR